MAASKKYEIEVNEECLSTENNEQNKYKLSGLSSTSDEEDYNESGYFDDVFSIVKTHCQIERLEDLSWFHKEMNRHTAEAILLANGVEGSYLLRNSGEKTGVYVVSARSKDAVKHFVLEMVGFEGKFVFGMGTFDNLKELLDHFDCKPILSTEAGVSITLNYPYKNDIPEPSNYEKVVRHGEKGKTFSVKAPSFDQEPDFHIASKEGYLIKRGAIHKNWKKRWFVLQKNQLKYFKKSHSEEEIRTINLEEAISAGHQHFDKMENCFKLELPQRTFYFQANSSSESHAWVDLLQWKIEYYKKRKADSFNTITSSLHSVHSVSEYASHIGEKNRDFTFMLK